MIQYLVANDTVTVFIEGVPHMVTEGAPNYSRLREAVLAKDWDAVPGLLTVEKAVETWLQGGERNPVGTPIPADVTLPGSLKDFTVKEGRVKYHGVDLPPALNDRILKMATKNESPEGLLNFWGRLQKNPNPHSVEQLFGFLQHVGIPIQKDGTLLAYKGVRMDFRDCHSGQFDNSPGQTIRMPRDMVSSDPSTACHAGLHVGALNYAKSFGKQVVIVQVDPKNVVCVPNDCDSMKMRTCEYTVVGLYGGQMPDTSFQVDTKAPARSDAASDTALPLTGTAWDDFNGMTAEELSGQTIADLRKYALYNCKITGASKFPGGKEALVAYIIDVCTPVAPLVEPEYTQPATTAGITLPITGTEWDALNGYDSVQLMEQSIADLRKYALHNCLIVGASKMPGGKIALVQHICNARRDANAE